MLNLVPFARSRRIVTHCDGHTGFVAQSLQVQFPCPLPVSVTAAAVGANQESSGAAVMTPAIQPPPPPDALNGEFRRFVRHSHIDDRAVARDIVGSIGNGLSLSQMREIMHCYLIGLSLR